MICEPDRVPRPPQSTATLDQAAAEIGESAETIRLWAKKSLVRSSRDDKKQRVFDLAELRRVQEALRNGKRSGADFTPLKSPTRSSYRAIELFTGCGGMALGFDNAGIQSELLIEWDKHACATLRQNWPDKNLVEDDVSGVNFGDYRGEIDIA